MRTSDLIPLWHSTVGFDRLFDEFVDGADHVGAQAASLENGLLKIDLLRELPEAMQPRKIAIGAPGNDNRRIEHKAA